MQIRIIAVGKIKEDYLKRAISDYSTRLTRYSKISFTEVSEEDIGRFSFEQVKAREAEQLLRRIPETAMSYIIALDREGEKLSSEQLSSKIEALMLEGRSDIAFIIGGAAGLDETVLDKADFKLSLSCLTFTHQIARFILIEQVYRAFKIIKNEPYHY